MNLNDLLRSKGIDPQNVLVLRHSPKEGKLKKALQRLAAHTPELFNAYQQTQTEQVERKMKGDRARYVAGFIGHEPGKAMFVGLYSIAGKKEIGPKEYWQIPENVKLQKYGVEGLTQESPRSSILWFDLELTDFYSHLARKLIVRWPGGERNWHRWADGDKNEFEILLPSELASKRLVQSTQGDDLISTLRRKDIDATTKKVLIDARLGQGRFRTDVLRKWGDCCSVTGSQTQEAIRASHIKPWSKSNHEERLDPDNGLPLVASLDALFDVGLISFTSSGRLIVSSRMTASERKIFGIFGTESLKKKPTAKTAAYLADHRRNFGFEE